MWEASSASFSYVFLRDVVTLWVNSVFLSLLIANEGLHWWLFLFRYSHPFWGSSRRIHTSSLGLSELLVAGGHAFTWLVTELCQGLSSPGLLCFVAFLPVLRSSLLWFCRFLWVLFCHIVHNLRDGVTPVGSRLVCPRSERRFSVFSLSLLYSHHMGRVCWLVPTSARPTVFVGASPFLLLDGLRTSV